ncbi:calnexin-like [Apostichopus japonicus]|uniref:calnexin-like n=1 Tax=Stichopus japonicus TaxID=307972 RepID=UPI003AB75BBF
MQFYWALMLLLATAMVTIRADDVDIEGEDEVVEVEQDEEPLEVFQPPTPSGPTYFHDAILTEKDFWKRWKKSDAKKDGVEDEIAKYDGKWEVESAEGSLEGDLGLVLKSKAKHHAIAVNLDTLFEFEEEPLIAQYEVKFQNGMECGGAYLKLLAGQPDLDSFQDKTRYSIMFGPDKCGADSKLHFIFQHKNPTSGKYEEKHAKKPTGFSHVFTDKKSHLFTLIIRPDNSYEILVDQKSVSSGSLLTDFTPPVNPPAEIADPNDRKPDDWDDRKKIPDPDAVKPDDWDEDAPARIPDPDAVKPDGWLDHEPEFIDDPDAEKPDDWDDELDGEWEPPQLSNPLCEEAGCGEWEPPMINNPDFKGKWKPALIDNPDYSGEWTAKIIPNPDFFEDLEPFRMSSIGAIGLELWSMTDDIYFDNFIITSDREVADNWAADTWKIRQRAEGGGSSGDSVVTSFMNATEEKPWLWVVVGLVVIIPLFLCIRICLRSGGSSEEEEEDTDAKKTDEPTPDDEEEKGKQEDGGKDEEKKEEEEDGKEEDEGVRQRKKPSKADLEEASQEEDEADAAAKEEKTEEEKKGESPKLRKSPRQKSRKD